MSPHAGIRRYWDSSCFLRILNREPGWEVCLRIVNAAKSRKAEICVSPMVYLEVVRPKGSPRVSAAVLDQAIDWFESDYFHTRIIDRELASQSRRYCTELNLHPRDAVHLACAVDLECDVLETLDKDLLKWDGKVPGSSIRIRRPGETQPDTALESHE